MPLEFVYRSVRPHECQQVVVLHRSVFSSEHLARTIYASSHIDRYLANLIAFSHLQKEHLLWGCWNGENLVGYAHFRALPESWHLNQVAVDTQFQGKGIGNALFNLWFDEGVHRGYRKLSLDVFQSNKKAIHWYKRRGFVATTRTWIYEEHLPPPSLIKSYDVRLEEWVTAEAWQSLYGFSQFQLNVDGETWCIGRLGDRYFRMTKYPKDTLKGLLSAINSKRRLLVFSPNSIMNADNELVEITLRMQCNLNVME